MITSLLICAAFASQQFITPPPMWEPQTPSVRSNSKEYRIRLSDTEACTIALTEDGNKVFINATSVDDGKPVKVSVQLSRAMYADGTELVILFYDNRPDKSLAPARMNQLNNFVLAFNYVENEQIRWFTSMFPMDLTKYSIVYHLKQGSASAPIPKATNP